MLIWIRCVAAALLEDALVHIGMAESGREQNFDDSMPNENEVHLGQAEISDYGQVEVTKMGDFLSRPVEIVSAAIPLGDILVVNLSIWDVFTKDPTVRAKLRNFAYLRGDMHVRVVVNGSPFHYGRLLVSYQPLPDTNVALNNVMALTATDATMKLKNCYLSQAPGASVINVCANEPVEMVLPFISPMPMVRLWSNDGNVLAAGQSFPGFENFGDLVITSINRIRSASTPASDVFLNVYAWMEEVNLGTNTASHIAIAESGRDEQKTGPIQRYSSALAMAAGKLVRVPTIGIYAMATKTVAQGLADVAAIFGWSKPVMDTNPGYVKNQPFMNGANTIGGETSKRITLDPKQGLTVDPRMVGRDYDEMAFGTFAANQTYYDTFDWDSIDNEGSTLYSVPIYPESFKAVISTPITAVQRTPLAWLTRLFGFWHGDIVIRVEVACSRFHRGKLAIYYDPNETQASLITVNPSYNKNFVQILDLAETNTMDIKIRWASQCPWLSIGGTGAYTKNGILWIAPFTKLQSPDESNVQVNLYVHAEDFHVNFPSNVNTTPNRPAAGLLRGVHTDWEEAKAESGIDTSDDVVAVTINPTTVNTSTLTLDYFGEAVVSFRSLLKRYVTVAAAELVPAAATAPRFCVLHAPLYPTINSPFTAVPVVNIYKEIFSLLRYCYIGMRGGIKYRYLHSRGSDNSTQVAFCDFMRVSRDSESNTNVPFSIAYYSAGLSDMMSHVSGTVTFMQATNAGIEFEIPYQSTNLFCASQLDSNDIAATTEQVYNKNWARNFNVTFMDYQSTGFKSFHYLDMAIGEDFNFFRFQGVPYEGA